MKLRFYLLIVCLFCLTLPVAAQDTPEKKFYLGVDLSYVNEVEACGAEFRVNGEVKDPYQIFHDYGANLVRVRLWHNPTWTNYSNFDDVAKSLRRAKDQGMRTLLDFHYSDTWADPSKQIIPAAWAAITDPEELGQAVYQYTFDTLMQLDALGLMPNMVQTGNEINTEMLRPENASGYPINWERNALLLNKALQAVRDADAQSDASPLIMLHVAKPEEVEGWLLAATRAGVTDFDIIGLSYYTGWSTHSIKTTGNVIKQLRYKFNKEVIIAETAYPWTLDGVPESAGNILGTDFVDPDYPATPDGQRQFMLDLTQTVLSSGGSGVIYWEPAWVSTSCSTLWGQGSHWENATFFDFNHANEVLPGMDFLRHAYTYPVEVTFRFPAEAGTAPEQIFFQGDFTGLGKRLLPVTLENGAYTLQTRLMPGTEIHYQVYSATPASAETALITGTCVDADHFVAVTILTEAILLEHTANGCPAE